ncbi:class I SAM-dependent methyltransferase [Rhodoblastus acidophilus]|uniref:Class I SAM-dependent methyltransferase n=1 Tax=Candidatus Rhodoblastus alkanivorans TaxID=2954117 RepID=A0ABS9Z9H1_9HYPH|nr:class I SAM-dependent methyltransferase [Candidatus Rhodoblastus alkanivorans]MCI4679985.1 class I SAM-dependent methyltransferase [Candidatus Rhodoblastus alkanivorans]MCI4684273.1 class I SAM-dependent methyltransferase [Candidatus Rhodoblastus alkanivorans]MDI4641593.1 class I SAM-dependent methyltransferase [Rhodoblastus acidophilus]
MPGYVELIDNFQVSGWCLQEHSNAADKVIIFLGDTEIAQVPCQLPRLDLMQLGLGTGNGGFCYVHHSAFDSEALQVRAVSSGEILPRVVNATKNIHPFRDDTPFEPIYAVVPESAPNLCEDPSSSLLTTDRKRVRFSLRARALVPLSANLRLAPTEDEQDIHIDRLEWSDAIRDSIPKGAPNYRRISADITVHNANEKRYITLGLTESNSTKRSPASLQTVPFASMCIPLDYSWLRVVPEGQNITRVLGAPDSRENFATPGLNLAYQIISLANHFLGKLNSPAILDWGIGVGRVAIPLKRVLCPDARVIGVDVDQVNAKWCMDNCPDIESSCSDFFPPLEIQSASIDLVYGISVMTHLTEGAQYAWLKELRRILRPGGICILSTHGEYAFLQHTEASKSRLVMQQLSSIGISDLLLDNNLGPLLAMKNYYRGTFQTKSQILSQWSKYMNIIAYYPACLDLFQDIVVLQK